MNEVRMLTHGGSLDCLRLMNRRDEEQKSRDTAADSEVWTRCEEKKSPEPCAGHPAAYRPTWGR
jgi:hypothetical protein